MVTFLYRIYLVLIVLPLFVVVTIICAVVTAIGAMIGFGRFFSYYPGKVWSRITLWLLLCPVTVRGREHAEAGRPYIVTPNHSSAVDIFVMYGFYDRPFKWVMKGSLRKIPFVGWACEKAGFIFVNLAKPMEVVRYSELAIKDGYSIMIFPEGTRSVDGKVTRLKKGAFRIAADTGAHILPATIRGAHEVLPKKGFWPGPHRLELTFYPPLAPEDYDNDPMPLLRSVQSTLISGTAR